MHGCQNAHCPKSKITRNILDASKILMTPVNSCKICPPKDLFPAGDNTRKHSTCVDNNHISRNQGSGNGVGNQIMYVFNQTNYLENQERRARESYTICPPIHLLPAGYRFHIIKKDEDDNTNNLSSYVVSNNQISGNEGGRNENFSVGNRMKYANKQYDYFAAEEGQVVSVHTLDAWNEQLREGNNTKKLMVVYFTASWSRSCRFIAPFVSELAKKRPKVIFVKVDVDELTSVSEDWNVEAMPTFMFLREGKIVDKIVGAKEDELQQTVANHYYRTKPIRGRNFFP